MMIICLFPFLCLWPLHFKLIAYDWRGNPQSNYIILLIAICDMIFYTDRVFFCVHFSIFFHMIERSISLIGVLFASTPPSDRSLFDYLSNQITDHQTNMISFIHS